MKTSVVWQDKIVAPPPRNAPPDARPKNDVWSTSWKPDGTELVVGVGRRVLHYKADGNLINSLRGHKDTVYAVQFSADGRRFASGGADSTVFIWKSTGEGILKFTHESPIQALAFNPITNQLASCAVTDFGLWDPASKNVQKVRVHSRICSADWSADGQHLALGFEDGSLSIRNREGTEQARIQKSAPVWCVAWSPGARSLGVVAAAGGVEASSSSTAAQTAADILAVGCWDQTLSFYRPQIGNEQGSGPALTMAQQGRERKLGGNPCSLAFFPGGEYLTVGGADRKVTLMTREGVKLATLAEKQDWVWSCSPRPGYRGFSVAVGCADGMLALHSVQFSTVHGLFRDRYAYRDRMTDVVVQHLVTEQRVRIKCKAYVKKIAVYRNRLAVQLPECINIYELSPDADDPYDMHYQPKARIRKALQCSLLVVTAEHATLCQDRRLQLFAFNGDKQREWVLESTIRYIKVVGGPAGGEGLLVGLKNGSVQQIFVSNPFPMSLVKLSGSVRCLDMSMERKRLAVVDDTETVRVFDVASKEQVWEAKGANSVAFNSGYEDMLCFSTSTQLAIRTGSFPLAMQPMPGFVVGFHRSMIFCLHYVAMRTVDVPQSASLYRYLDSRSWDAAYRVACLGVTESDWRLLGREALKALQLEVARRAFVRVRDMRYIELINHIEHARRTGSGSDPAFVGLALAYEGKFAEAARTLVRGKQARKAIEMFTDLRMWDRARELAATVHDVDVKDLMLQQARACEATGDFAGAAKIFASVGDYRRAVELHSEHKDADGLLEVVKQMPASEEDTLRLAARLAQALGKPGHMAAQAALRRLGDQVGLVKLLVVDEQLAEARAAVEKMAKSEDPAVAAQVPRMKEAVFVPLARQLAIDGDFEGARDNYIAAGRPDLAAGLLVKLALNASIERRFGDAARCLWRVAEAEAAAGRPVEECRAIRLRGDAYQAFDLVFEFVHAPFSQHPPDTVLNAAAFLLSVLVGSEDPNHKSAAAAAAAVGANRASVARSRSVRPAGISERDTLYALARTSVQLQAYKTARSALDSLATHLLPKDWRDSVDVTALRVQAKAYVDPEQYLPVCYRCGTTNQLATGRFCANCGAEFVRSGLTFEPLPVVEFVPPEGMEVERALEIAGTDVVGGGAGAAAGQDGWQETQGGNAQTLTFAEHVAGVGEGGKPSGTFEAMLHEARLERGPIRVTEQLLRGMGPRQLVVVKEGGAVRLFRNMLDDIPLSVCASCQHVFPSAEFEAAVLERGCPCCKADAKAAGLEDDADGAAALDDEDS